MIVIQLVGGLGNQLFQYAAGIATSTRLNTDLYVDISEFAWHSKRKFALYCFNEQPKIAKFKHLFAFLPVLAIAHLIAPHKKNLFQKVLIKIFKSTILKQPLWKLAINPSQHNSNPAKVFIQPSFHYFEKFLQIPNQQYLVGFWSSEKFFNQYESLIRSKLTFQQNYYERFASQLLEFKSYNSISIHIRRGDKLNNPAFAISSLKFVNQAIEFIISKVTNPSFFVFSDDPEWASKNIEHKTVNIKVLSGTITKSEHDDLFLMSHCAHNIIAASTFSWWGAWLNQNPNKIVVCPNAKEWFLQKHESEVVDLLPTDWIKI